SWDYDYGVDYSKGTYLPWQCSTATITVVPEPATVCVLGIGIAVMAVKRRHLRR
ncbi:MAG: PEP-CTERM sorting domain-containing protein, partial [Lysobacterales bacterium]